MNLKRSFSLAGFFAVMFAAQIVFAQEAVSGPTDTVLITNQQAVVQQEGEMQWAWGEVTQLDELARTLTLKYLDYETDQEKDLLLTVDDKTTFENFKKFSELKVKDTLSIDYVSGADNLNIAKNISLEKPDEAVLPVEIVPVPEATAVPVAAAPAAETVTQAPAAPAEAMPVAPSMEMNQEPAPALTPAQEPAPAATPAQEPVPAAAQ